MVSTKSHEAGSTILMKALLAVYENWEYRASSLESCA